MVSQYLNSVAEDIREMKIRGAGEIARYAVKGLIDAAKSSAAPTRSDFLKEMEEAAAILIGTRPTAVSLPNAVRSVLLNLKRAARSVNEVSQLKDVVLEAGEAFIKNSQQAMGKIAEFGARRIEDGDTILTHCHSTAVMSILKEAHRQGRNFSVYTTESRPRYQGRITASQLSKEGIPVTMIVDSAVRHVIRKISKVLVGADAVTANGAVVNKIGTSTVALVAHEARVHVLVAAESYKFSPETTIGKLITIEERASTEIIEEEYLNKYRNIKIRNPAFDITPAEYIDLIITERGVIPPQAAILILREEFGWSPSEETEIRVTEEDNGLP